LKRRRLAAPAESGFAGGKGQQMKFVSHRRGRIAVRAKDVGREVRHVLQRGRAGALILGLAAAAAVAVPASASASTGAFRAGTSPVVGHVYVNDNTAETNTIAAFNRHADGTLTPEAGSPFPAGGAGTGTGLSDQGAIQITPDGRFLIAVDAGSNQISVLRIDFDGSLSLVSVVGSGGTLPDSVAVHGNLVYVANSGNGGSNYTGFRFFGGHLFRIPGSIVTLAANAAPADVLFNGTGTKLVGTEVGTSVIDSFTVGFDGRLTAAPGSPFKAQGLGPFGSEFRPTNPGQLFVSNAHNVGAGTGTISAYTDSLNGALTPVAGSPFADDQTAPCWIEITHDGQFLFTVNTGSGEISRYQIAPDGTLALLGSTPVGQTGGVGAVDARLSPDGRYLYVDESRVGKVGAFAVSGGNLTELGTSPFALPAGATPAGIVVS
jgi:6-phosphogluconolactonase